MKRARCGEMRLSRNAYVKETTMRHRHSESRPPSQPQHPSQPPTRIKQRDRGREDRSKSADAGAAPAQNDDRDGDEDRKIQEEPTAGGQEPRVEPRDKNKRQTNTRKPS
jgi:hypothetical protein